MSTRFTCPVVEALRRSQIALSEKPETSHPAFWAAFVLVRDGG